VPGAGTPARPQLTDQQAEEYTILRYLESSGGVGAPVADPWDPTAGLGDLSGITANFRVAASGGSHTTVQAAIDAAVAAGGAERLYVAVSAGTYREVVCVPSGAPPITLYGLGAGASETVVVFDNYNGKAKAGDAPANPCNPNLGSATFGTSGSATFAAYAAGFQAKNLTISNDTERAPARQSGYLLRQDAEREHDQPRLREGQLRRGRRGFHLRPRDPGARRLHDPPHQHAQRFHGLRRRAEHGFAPSLRHPGCK
jgi:pectinesterase